MSEARRPMDGLPDDLTPREVAELYAAGALTPAEVAAFEARVRAGDAPFVEALVQVEPAMQSLSEIALPEEPPAEIRAAIMARLGLAPSDADRIEHGEGHVGVSAGVAAGITVMRASAGRWTRTGIPGVRMRTLLADRKANRRTILLEMAPGSALPDHSHAGVEEVFLLSGDLHIGGHVLREHDYIRVERGAEHGVPRTESGCVCIVISDYVPFPLTSLLGFVWTAVKSLVLPTSRKK